jgi:lipopolysaccharide export system permease protein
MQLAVDLLDRILSKGLDLTTVMEIFLVNLAWIIALSVPMAVMTSCLMAFGQMSADNEILAIRASGLNLSKLIVPVFLASIIISILLVFFNNSVLPEANHRHSSLMSDISRKKPAALIEPDVLIRDFTNYAIHVKDVRGRTGKVWGVKIFQDVPGQDPTTIVADSGELHVTKDEKRIQATLYNGESHSISKENNREYFVGRFARQIIYIDNVDSELRRTERDFRGDREKSAGIMTSEIKDLKRERREFIEQNQTAISGLISQAALLDSMSAASADTSFPDSIKTFAQWTRHLSAHAGPALRRISGIKGEVERLSRKVRQNDLKISQYLVEVHKKFSIPATCIVFVLIGAPLGIMARRGGLGVGASYSVFFFIVFWAFLIGGEFMADRLLAPPWLAMWSGDILIAVCGIFLLIRMLRESSFISWAPLVRMWRGFLGKRAVKTFSKATDIAEHTLFRIPVKTLNFSTGILSAYVLRLFVKFMIGIITALVVVFVVIDYVSNLRIFENASMRNIGLYYWYYMAWFIQLIAPIGILLASMLSMGRLAKYSELTAMKASGVNLRRVTIPLLFFGLILAGANFYFAEKVLPEANARRKEIREDMKAGRQHQSRQALSGQPLFHRNFFYFGSPDIVYCFQEFRTHPQRSRNVWRETFNGNRISERVSAEKLNYENGKWLFINGQARSFSADTSNMVVFDTLADTVLTASPEEMSVSIKGVEEMSFWELRDAIEKIKKRGENAAKYSADLHFKIALPFMNLIVIMLGVSITARAGRKGGAVLFGIGLLIVFSYWIISQFGLALGQDERLSPVVAAWTGNVIFLALGLILYRKAAW